MAQNKQPQKTKSHLNPGPKKATRGVHPLRAKTQGVSSKFKARLQEKANGKSNSDQPNASQGFKVRRQTEAKRLTYQEASERISDILFNHGLKNLSNDNLVKLTKFFFLLLEEQQSHNSTRLRTLREVAIKHYVDCLIVPQFVELKFPLLDVGTGPGFPGIPLKILFPNEPIILAEGVQKRVEFLKRVRELLKLEKLDIIGRQVNENFQYPVPAIITRAFADVSDTLGQVKNCLQTDGHLYLMKGPSVDPEIARAKELWGKSYELIQNVAYELPNTPHQRRLLVYKKL
jgi:16S rRNA (guanine527-N7)-methyltransferase